MLSAVARTSAPRHLFESFLAVDALSPAHSNVEAARTEFEELVNRASPCASRDGADPDRAQCVVAALFATGLLTAVAEPGDPDSSTVTSALVSHRGNCAALSALALSIAESVGVPLEAVVFPQHVVVRSPADPDHAFELLQRGSKLTMSQLRKRLGADGARDVRVRTRDFPTYYLDNLAVRFAEAGNADRAEAMFQQAIDAGSRVARVRFNYGTFLLGKDRLKPAAEQLRRAVRLDHRSAPCWANLGVAVARLGDTSGARRCFERALRYEPRNRIATENLKALGRNGPPPPH